MDIYFAASLPTLKRYNTHLGLKKILVSFYEINSRNLKPSLDVIRKFKNLDENNKVFLDSGAFSAWSLGIKINLIEYIKFIKTYKKLFDVVASLDVKGSHEKSIQNHKEMLRAGLDYVLPVYHRLEPLEVLDEYVDMGSEYIAIGNIAAESKSSKRKFVPGLRQTIDRIPKDIKIHLFGMTSFPILKMMLDRITSSDSSSWNAVTKYGQLINAAGKFVSFKPFVQNDNYLGGVVTERWLPYNAIQLMRLEQVLTEMQEHQKTERYKLTRAQ